MPVFKHPNYTELISQLLQVCLTYGYRKDREVRTGAAMEFIAFGEYQQVVIVN